MPFVSPHKLAPGAPLTSEVIRDLIAYLEQYKFTGRDIALEDGKFVIDADLDLTGHSLLGAKNVPVGIINVRAKGVMADGVTDDTGAIQNALNEIANDGFRMAYFPAGTYVTSEVITIPNGVSIFGTGSETKFKLLTVREDPGFRVTGSATIRDISFVGESTHTRSGIFVDVGGDVTIDNIYGEHLRNLVELSGTAANKAIVVTDIVARSCVSAVTASTVRNIVVSGVLADACTTGISARGCVGFRFSGISVAGTSATETGVLLDGCNAGSITGGVDRSGGRGFWLNGCYNVTMLACHAVDSCYGVSGSAFPGIELTGCHEVVVHGCQSYITSTTNSTMTYALQLSGNNNVVSGNVLGPTTDRGNPATLVYDKARCYKDDGSNTLEYGNFKVVL